MFAEIQAALPEIAFRARVPYEKITTLGCGGVLPLLAEIRRPEELPPLRRYLMARTIPSFVIGGGSNLAGMDAPYPGVAIQLSAAGFSRTAAMGELFSAQAGIRMAELARQAADAGFGGLAELAGIPGTLGGALKMNAGANGRQISDFLVELDGLKKDGAPFHALKSDLEWDYRCSSIPNDVIVTSATFALPKIDPAAELEKIKAEVAARRRREPKARTAGCAFRNAGSESAGKLIEQCGLKGRRMGAFEVSSEHGNFILNHGGGQEADLLQLMKQIRREVAERFGIHLEPEIVFVNPGSLNELYDAVPAPRVAVLKGGSGSEREVSLRSGDAVAGALRRAGYEVRELDLKECEITPEMTAADAVYPVLHGGFGEDGRLQRLLEAESIPFVGSGSTASALVMDKIATKEKLRELGLPTAEWAVLTPDHRDFPAGLNLPVVLKAPCEGSTIGIEKVERIEDFAAAADRIFEFDRDRVLAEEFIAGSEFTVPVIDGRVFPAVEIRSPHGFYDYDAKYVYQSGRTEYFCPARSLTEEQLAELNRASEIFYREFDCRDILRVDFMVDRAGRFFILEGNTIPGCTATSLVPKSARAAGWSFEFMAARLARAALQRRKRKNGNE